MKKSVLPLLTSSLAHLCAKPHPYHSVNAPACGKSYSLAMQQLLPRVVAIFLLALVSSGAWAADYVIKSGNYYLQVNNGSLSATTTFNPATCVWNDNNNTFNCNEKTLGYSQTKPTWNRNDSGTRPYTSTINLTGTSTNFAIKNNKLTFSAVGNQTKEKRGNAVDGPIVDWYINFNDGNIIATMESNDNNNATATAITYTNVSSSTRTETKSVTVSISPLNTSIYSGATETFTATAKAKRNNYDVPEHQTFVVGGTTYYKYDNQYYTSTSGFERSPEETDETVDTGVTYSWSLTGDANQYLSPTSGTGAKFTTKNNNKTTTDYSSTLKVTATYDGKSGEASTNVTALYPRIDPTAMSSLTISPSTVYVGKTAQLTYILTPENCHDNVTFTSGNKSIATVDANGVVTGISVGAVTITATAHKMDDTTIEALTKSITVNVKNQVATPIISFSPTTSNNGETATATISCATEGATIYYTTDGSAPTNESTKYNGNFTVNNLDIVKAIAYPSDATYWDASEIASATYAKHKVATPTITINNGKVSFSCNETGTVTYYYTTDGSTPTTSSTKYTEPFTPTSDECTIKVIATMANAQNSDVAERPYVVQSGVKGNTVIINDYEDHNWSYYTGVDNSVDPTADGKYNTKYRGHIYSPDPRNVKITYSGGGVSGASAVAISGESGEGQNAMVYFITLEKFVLGEFTDANTDGVPDNFNLEKEWYPYTVISNPFSKRPRTEGSTGNDGYYGFNGWKIVKGGKYIGRGANNTQASDGDVLNLDEKIHFINIDGNYTPNCTSAEIELEATWASAEVKTGTSMPTFTEGYNSYERNFWVISGNIQDDITLNTPCTIIGRNPDGTTGNYDNYTIQKSINGGTNNVKVEWVKISANNNYEINAQGYTMTVGRGVVCTVSDYHGPKIFAINKDADCVGTFKIESGKYYNFRQFGTDSDISSSRQINNITIIGCDYDRARANTDIDDDPYSNKLKMNQMSIGNGKELGREAGELYGRCIVKSGNLIYRADAYNGSYDGTGESQNFYYSEYTKRGGRFLTVEGGHLRGITGGSDGPDTQRGHRALTLRIRGTARIDGLVCGAASGTNSSGDRVFVFTGGKIGGWIAAGANGLQTGNGQTNGESYLYIGGNTQVDSHLFTTTTNNMGHSTGGAVYGTGCGTSTESTSGQMAEGTNIVLADDAYIERGIYGGGALGYIPDDQTSNIYILGGHVGGKEGRIHSDQGWDKTVQGGVYGGACNRGGGSSNIYMLGGLVEGGIYGGSNEEGTLAGSTNVFVIGGQVGTPEKKANIHGGGYGQPTRVTGNVDVTIGKENAIKGAVIYGDVYGGSALGHVNGEIVSTKHTNVTLNAGTINGSLYGGGLGSSAIEANVYGPVQVSVYGGTVNTTSASGSGAIYGCNNINGAPQSTVNVDIYGTNPAPSADAFALDAVYGGGNMANYDAGTPVVVVHNCDNSIGYVYGGGNAAHITNGNTDITIFGGNTIGNVFGGGNGQVKAANISGSTNVKVYGGTIGEVYGGSNTNGTIGGTISVNVNAQAETDHDACPIDIDNVYGGGNKAPSNAGNVIIGCAEHIGAVYGGANQANITGNINLSISSGHIDNVFGGNNNSGEISGSITVTVHDSGNTCGMEIGNVFGAGNLATYGNGGNYPVVNILNGTISGNVFGGGKGNPTDNTHTMGSVIGNPQVTIGDYESGHKVVIKGDVYGGGDLAAVEGGPTVTIRDCDTEIDGNLYGGGNAAPVYSTNTTVWGGHILGNVFGGGNGSDPSKNSHGAQVGYKSDDSTAGAGDGNAVTSIHGGTIGTWEMVDGQEQCTSGGGIFGGSNTNGNIRGTISLSLDEKAYTEITPSVQCPLILKEVYGAGNQAAYTGTGIVFTLGCVSVLGEIYGGAKEADLNGDVHLKITSGHFDRVCGGNNLGGKLNGSIKVTVDETGCNRVTIDELYGGGNQAAYSVYGYDTNGKPKTTGDKLYDDPEVNIVSCTSIGQVFGGGLGNTAVMVGDPHVNINMIKGKYSDNITNKWNNKLGTIGEVFGGGNAAKVEGDTYVNIGTQTTVLRADGTTNATVEGVNISGNVYGGGNAADVTGKTHVQVGPKPTAPTTN